MDHKPVLENSSAAAVYTLRNTTCLYEVCKLFEYQTETDLLNEPLT